MKAPDKIYIHEASAPELAEPVLKEYHIVYIRKDALLEWAKECVEMYPNLQSFEFLIDKLNSL